ncbi:MAG: hypothetical protein C0454_03985 [Parvibaculum sp.]|jgi:ElaB/YqjD/DUF883 family membrane-anchored ribosome-binding protein|nr:hypothetical protein [Parvibaculum sp.]
MADKKTDNGPSIEDLQAQIEALKSALEEAHAAAAEAGIDLALEADAVRERMQEGLEDIRSQIDAHPLPSALLAFGIGFLIGRLLAR